MKHLQLLIVIGTRHKTSQCIVALAHTALHIGFRFTLEIGLVLSQVKSAIASEPRFQVAGGLYW